MLTSEAALHILPSMKNQMAAQNGATGEGSVAVNTTLRYRIARPGCTAWAEADSVDTARARRDEANRVCQPGHIIYDRVTGTQLY